MHHLTDGLRHALQRQDLTFRAGTPPNVDVGVLAVARRPSWGNRSSSFEVSLGAGPNIVGYSVSPMLDSLEGSLFMSSTPKHGHQLPFSLPSQASSPLTQQGACPCWVSCMYLL